MKLRANTLFIKDGKYINPGEIFNVEESIGKAFIESGLAEEVKIKSKEKIINGENSTISNKPSFDGDSL